MTVTTSSFAEFFHAPGATTLPEDVLGELASTGRIHDLSPQEVFFKWESYALKMGAADTRLDLDTVRAFKRDVQEGVERERRAAAASNKTGSERKERVMAAPRAGIGAGDDFLGMLEGMTPKTPATSGTAKRKAANETPAPSKAARSAVKSSPTDRRAAANGIAAIPFNERTNAGQVVETLNGHLEVFEPPIAPPAGSRVTLKANTDLKKFSYKPLAMHQSEASEVLDERIDEFMSLVQEGHGLEASIFGNAASKSTSEIIAVGRIASDTLEGKLIEASLVLEMSRRQGAGLRVPLKLPSGTSHEFFPGQIVAVRGTNASGDYFSVSEVLDIPLLPPSASLPSAIEASNARLGLEDPSSTAPSASHALNLLVSSGPYTADDNLDFEPLHALCDKAQETSADVLLLTGPFLDAEHPLVATGDFDLPSSAVAEPDRATLSDAFRHFISEPLRRLAQAHPHILIVLVPSARDAVNRHVAWPQDAFSALRKELGLPKQARGVTNPCTLSLNEVVLGVCAQDALNDLRREEAVVGGGRPTEPNLLARLPRHLIRQRHFYPLYPPGDRTALPKPAAAAAAAAAGEFATGTPLDPSYLKLGEWLNVRPDVLVVPSALLPFAKVVESVVAVNPGPLSKRRGAGTYAQLTVHPRKLSAEESNDPGRMVGHHVFERARVDVVRI